MGESFSANVLNLIITAVRSSLYLHTPRRTRRVSTFGRYIVPSLHWCLLCHRSSCRSISCYYFTTFDLDNRRTPGGQERHRPRPPRRRRPQLPSPGAVHREPAAAEGVRDIPTLTPSPAGFAGLSRFLVLPVWAGWRWCRGSRGASSGYPSRGLSHRFPGARFGFRTINQGFQGWCPRPMPETGLFLWDSTQ